MNENKQLLSPIVEAFYEWNNATTSFKSQIALRRLKQIMQSLKQYVESEDNNSEQDLADEHAADGGKGDKKSADHPKPSVSPTTSNGEHASTV
jgi:hypothetical protein